MQSTELRRARNALVLPILLLASGTALADNQSGNWVLTSGSVGNYEPIYSNGLGSAVNVMVTACGNEKNSGLVNLALFNTKSNVLIVFPAQCQTALVSVPAGGGLQIIDRSGGVTATGTYMITTPVP